MLAHGATDPLPARNRRDHEGSIGLKRPEIPAFPGLWIFLPRIQPITGFKFSDHVDFVSRGRTMPTLPSRISTSKTFRSTLAGPLVTLPVRTSKHELCQGHCTLNPSNLPSDNGPKRWVQNS